MAAFSAGSMTDPGLNQDSAVDEDVCLPRRMLRGGKGSGGNEETLTTGTASPFLCCLCAQHPEKDEEAGIRYRYWVYHLALMMAGGYIAVLLTNWRYADSGGVARVWRGT